MITEIMYDPDACPDSEGQWVELYNAGTASVDITGWSIENSSDPPVTINSFTLPSGGYFIMGATIDGCGGLNADQDGLALLSNTGLETVTLRDETGTVMDTISYTGSSAARSGYTLERGTDTNGQPIDTGAMNDFQESSMAGGTPRAGYFPPNLPPTLPPNTKPTRPPYRPKPWKMTNKWMNKGAKGMFAKGGQGMNMTHKRRYTNGTKGKGWTRPGTKGLGIMRPLAKGKGNPQNMNAFNMMAMTWKNMNHLRMM